MEIPVNKLSGVKLDYMTVVALGGVDIKVIKNTNYNGKETEFYNIAFRNNKGSASIIFDLKPFLIEHWIDKYRIQVTPPKVDGNDYLMWRAIAWERHVDKHRDILYNALGETLKLAIQRCFISAVLGEKVKVPDEIVMIGE